eukprot:scaffold3570_cov69-Phaeocystis_antarctica.AAC.1
MSAALTPGLLRSPALHLSALPARSPRRLPPRQTNRQLSKTSHAPPPPHTAGPPPPPRRAPRTLPHAALPSRTCPVPCRRRLPPHHHLLRGSHLPQSRAWAPTRPQGPG